MPRVSVATTLARAQREINILEGYLTGSQALGVKHQHFIGEVVMLRLFSVLEQGVSEFALKFACGASYSNGTAPLVLQKCRSIDNAFAKMTTYGRATPKVPKWTKAKFVRDTIQYVLDINDHFYADVRNHGALINEMRIVRNHIAHRTQSTQREFRGVARQRYGANAAFTPGAFLVSTRRHAQPNIVRYLRSTRALLRVISNG